jgi:uncharacterized protein
MRCPVCLDAELVEHIRDGIEVDHCHRCRGIWLDRGELDKLLDLAEARAPEPRITRPEPRHAPEPLPADMRQHGWDDHDRDAHRGHRKRKRKGAFAELLEDVFEAFD